MGGGNLHTEVTAVLKARNEADARSRGMNEIDVSLQTLWQRVKHGPDGLLA